MTRTDIIDYVKARSTVGLTNAQAEEVMDLVFDGVRAGLVKDGETKVRGFGTFLVKKHKAKKGMDIRRMTPVDIPERSVVKFRPSPLLEATIVE